MAINYVEYIYIFGYFLHFFKDLLLNYIEIYIILKKRKEGEKMAFSYDKLWKLLIDKKMTKENFRILIKASPTTIAAMGKGEGISPKVLDRICTAFNCQPGDIMEHIPNHISNIE